MADKLLPPRRIGYSAFGGHSMGDIDTEDQAKAWVHDHGGSLLRVNGAIVIKIPPLLVVASEAVGLVEMVRDVQQTLRWEKWNADLN